MELAYTYPTTILPWDTISIIEEGNRVATFYVGQVTDSQPGAVITINAQDNSKRLSDYFITENYTVDRRSHAKKWITKFLDEAGVDWQYTASGNGGILTNNTTMGMQSAYEQIMTLLQLSGWYIRFDEYGKAFIGELSTVPPNFSTVDYVNFPCSGIFTGNGNLPGYGDFPCSGTFIGLGLITGHEVYPQAGIFLLDSTFTGEGDIVGSGTFPCAGIFHGTGFYLGAGTFPGNGTFSGDGNFTDPGVYPGYSAITTSGIFTCYGTYPKVGTRLDNDIILDIKLDKNDRMYRNRVVVWGNGDSDTGSWVFADVSLVGNKWDYDANDRRTIVIANSNIPDAGDAFDLANQALMEFGRLSVEKRLTVAGAVPVKVGDIVLVINELYTGNGLVTSFGVSMTKAGLISNIVLDERCPRLFGYFHPRILDDPFIPSGTLAFPVYVSTFGDGVWRKTNSGITESGWAGSMWEDYSYGLTELDITDLHVNEGVLVNVTSAGDSYSSLEANGYWEKINLNSLSVTVSGVTESYSDLKARACIIDRDSNSLRIAVDNCSGINYGDFLMSTNPFDMLRFSGYLIGAGTVMRSWVVEASPNGAYVTDSHPVSHSGNYEFFVTDIANDGTYDYVESMTLGSGIFPYNINYGIYEGADYSPRSYYELVNYHGGYDNRMSNFMPYSGTIYPAVQPTTSQQVTTPWTGYDPTNSPVSLYDYLPASNSFAAWTDENSLPSHVMNLRLTEFYYDAFGDISCVTYSGCSNMPGEFQNMRGGNYFPGTIILIKRVSTYVYDYYAVGPTFPEISTPPPFTLGGAIYRNRMDFFNMTIDISTIVDGLPIYGGLVVGDSLYGTTVDVTTGDGFDIYLHQVNITTGEVSSKLIKQFIGNNDLDVVGTYTSYTHKTTKLFQSGDSDVRFITLYTKVANETFLVVPPWPLPPYLDWSSTIELLGRLTYDLYLESSNLTDVIVGQYTVDTNILIEGNFNKDNQYLSYTIKDATDDSIIGDVVDTFNGFVITYGEDTSSLKQYGTIYNIRGTSTDAVGKLLDDTFTNIDMTTGEPTTAIVPATSYVWIYNDFDDPPPNIWEWYPYTLTLKEHQGVVDSFNGEHFYKAYCDLLGEVTVALNSIGVITRITGEARLGDVPEQMFGNFRIGGPNIHLGRRYIKYVPQGDISAMWPIYVLFARDGDDYILLKSGIYQERVEVSEYYPIVTMDRRVSSLESRLITMDGQVQLSTHPAMIGYNIPNSSGNISVFNAGITSDDFKYADFGRVAESGLSREILVIYSGGVGSIDAINLTSFSGLYTTYSGVATRIETTNYQLPDQYLFLSVSGAAGDMSFFQRDPDGGTWVDYSSGYPQSRTTQIRICDSI